MARGRVFFDGTLTRPQLDHPECVAVAPDGSVWCGGERGQIFRITADGSQLAEVATTDGFVLGIAFGPDGLLYVCDLAHRAVFRMDTDTGTVSRYTDGGSRPFGVPNFVAISPDGTVYVSDSHRQGEPGGGIYRFAPDGSGGLWSAVPLNFANGLALAPDGSAIYVVESFRPGVTKIPIEADGAAGAPVPVLSLPGTVPDGIAFGPDGLLYLGFYEPSRVARADLATGVVETVLEDPTAHLLCHPTNLAFRGTELFTSNLGRWHVTLIDALADPVT